MINKKNLWFLTLFSLVLVLSIYYVTMPNEIFDKNIKETTTDNSTTKVEETSIISALKVEDDNNVMDKINSLKEKLTSTDISTEEKNSVFEELKLLNKNSSKEETIELKIKELCNCENFVKQVIERFGQIDVLVNNAGITKDMLLMRMKKEDFEQVIDTNLVGTFNVTKNVVPYMMKARSGRIINISSVVGISGNAGQTNYSASKAGIIGFTKSLAKEIASRNILVNAVAPGFIETNMTDVLKDDVKQEIAKNIPLKRMGTTQDVANVVKFLASDDSSYITGQVINVDGGMLM